MNIYYVYILASDRNGTLYIGVTNDLSTRIFQHKQGIGSVFTRKYKVDKLVAYKEFNSIDEAIEAEKRMKRWKRRWKLDLIERSNPEWLDLYTQL